MAPVRPAKWGPGPFSFEGQQFTVSEATAQLGPVQPPHVPLAHKARGLNREIVRSRANRQRVATWVILESKFWAGVLGGTVDDEDEWHMVLVDGKPRVGVQLTPDHVPPDWPDGTPQQIHLDLWVDDVDAAHEEVMSLGIQPPRHPFPGGDPFGI